MERSLSVYELDRDRSSRVARIHFGKKEIVTPSFFPLLHGHSDFQALQRLRSSPENIPHVGGFIVRTFDAHDVLPAQSKAYQLDITGRVVTDSSSLFLSNTVFAIDPSTEYLYYEAKMKRFLESENSLDLIRNYVRNLLNAKKSLDSKHYANFKLAAHKQFWNGIQTDASLRNQLMRKYFQDAMRLGADFLIPPVPLALDDSLFDIATRMNDVGKELALALGRKECATYFLFSASALRDRHLLDKMKEYVLYSSSRMTIVKFKYLDITSPAMLEERQNYRDLLSDIAYFSKTFRHRCFMVLENSYQSFPSAVVGFDVVSGSITGFDGDGGHSEYPFFGKWIDPRLMVPVDWETVRRMFTNTGGRLPCHHEVCRSVTNIDKVSQDLWNTLRRQHYCLYHNDMMSEIARAVRERTTEFAQQRLGNSQLAILRSLVANPS